MLLVGKVVMPVESKKKITAEARHLLGSVQYANKNIERINRLLEVIRSSSKLRTCTQLCNELVLRESVAKPRAL